MGCELCKLEAAPNDNAAKGGEWKTGDTSTDGGASASGANSSTIATGNAPANGSSQSVSLSFLGKVKLFQRLPKDQHSLLQKICEPLEVPQGSVLIKQGDDGNEFYVIVTGSVSVTVDGKQVATLGVGDYFGEMALLRSEPRTATITAATPLSVLMIRRDKFQESGLINKLEFAKRAAVGGGGQAPLVTKPPSPKTENDRSVIKNALKTNQNLAGMVELSDAQCTAMTDVAWEEEVPPGKAVIEQGSDQADYFYIVKQGSFEILIDKPDGGQSADAAVNSSVQQVGVVQKGGSFGELALIYFALRAATVKCREQSILWVIDRNNFKQIIAKSGDDLAKQMVSYLDQSDFFKELKADEKLEVTKSLQEKDFAQGENIVDQGDKNSAFHILVGGEIAVGQRRLKGTASAPASFGESSLLGNAADATAQVVSATAKTLSMDKKSFEMLLGPLADIKKRGAAGQSKVGQVPAAASTPAAPASGAPKTKIKRDELKTLGLLGCGGFGAVDLVQHTVSKETYALKALSKGHVVKCRMQKSVMQEKTIQYMCDSPFIVKLYECFNQPQNLEFLLELALGGELYDTYCKKGFHGNVPHAMYYCAGTTFAFEHLHEKKIIFRDLKPENLLLADEGKIKLTDMGLAKVVVGKTNTTCGTPDYFAPEVIGSAGHTHAVDWYTLGILLFELMTGHPPFESASPSQTMGKIQKGISKATFPAKIKGPCEDLVKNLCNKTPNERLPMKKGGVQNIMKHPWYGSFDWQAMKNLTLDAPYKPVIKSKTDSKNFSASPADKPPQIPYKDDGSGWDKDFAT